MKSVRNITEVLQDLGLPDQAGHHPIVDAVREHWFPDPRWNKVVPNELLPGVTPVVLARRMAGEWLKPGGEIQDIIDQSRKGSKLPAARVQDLIAEIALCQWYNRMKGTRLSRDNQYAHLRDENTHKRLAQAPRFSLTLHDEAMAAQNGNTINHSHGPATAQPIETSPQGWNGDGLSQHDSQSDRTCSSSLSPYREISFLPSRQSINTTTNTVAVRCDKRPSRNSARDSSRIMKRRVQPPTPTRNERLPADPVFLEVEGKMRRFEAQSLAKVVEGLLQWAKTTHEIYDEFDPAAMRTWVGSNAILVSQSTVVDERTS